MADRSFILFDTATFGATAGVDFPLFQVAEGGDATHVKAFTNSRGAGQLPSTESFKLEKFEVFPDVAMSQADTLNMLIASYLSFEINNQELIRLPLAEVMGGSKLTGFYTQAAAATDNMMSASHEGFMLEIPISIPGGVPFKVTLHQGTATAAAQNVKCALIGTLTTP